MKVAEANSVLSTSHINNTIILLRTSTKIVRNARFSAPVQLFPQCI